MKDMTSRPAHPGLADGEAAERRWRVPGWVLLGCALAWPAAHADGPIDHRRAREAVLAGEIRPLAEILQRVQSQLGGEVIATELEREHGRWVYEFKVLRPDGRLVEWYVDARDGSVLKTEVKKGKR